MSKYDEYIKERNEIREDINNLVKDFYPKFTELKRKERKLWIEKGIDLNDTLHVRTVEEIFKKLT